MKKNYIIALILFIGAVAAAGFWESRKLSSIIPSDIENDQTASSFAPTNENDQGSATSTIASFEDCAAAGNEVVGEKPNRRCIVSDDLAYIEIETCAAQNGSSMNIFEARHIFNTGKCAWEGSAQEDHFCNEASGAWEIGIASSYRENCNAICVIDITKKESRVEWRCN